MASNTALEIAAQAATEARPVQAEIVA